MSNQWFGWVKDDYDARDAEYTDQLYDRFHREGQQIEESVDLREQCPPIYNQDTMGSCTANAIAAALRFGRMKKLGHSDENFDPSRLYIYFNERMLSKSDNGWTNEQRRTYDSGARIRDGIRSFGKFGVCPENQWAYSATPAAVNQQIGISDGTPVFEDVWPPNAWPCTPPAGLYEREDDWKTYLGTELAYYRLGYQEEPDPSDAAVREAAARKVDQLKRCLSSGYPFVFGFSTYTNKKIEFNSVSSENFDENGAMKFVADTSDLDVGGHAVLAVGYRNGYFIIRNSWGDWWGTGKDQDGREDGYKWGIKDPSMAGHFLMSEEWFLTPERTYDFYLIEVKTAVDVDPRFL